MARILMLFLAVLTLAMSAGFTTGCNTMEGFGEDLEEGGEALSDEARREKYD